MNCAKVQKVVLSTSLQPHLSPQITLPATSLTRALEINVSGLVMNKQCLNPSLTDWDSNPQPLDYDKAFHVPVTLVQTIEPLGN